MDHGASTNPTNNNSGAQGVNPAPTQPATGETQAKQVTFATEAPQPTPPQGPFPFVANNVARQYQEPFVFTFGAEPTVPKAPPAPKTPSGPAPQQFFTPVAPPRPKKAAEAPKKKPVQPKGKPKSSSPTHSAPTPPQVESKATPTPPDVKNNRQRPGKNERANAKASTPIPVVEITAVEEPSNPRTPRTPVETAGVVRRINVSFALPDKMREALRSMYPAYQFYSTSPTAHTHPFANIERRLAEERVVEIAKTFMPRDPSDWRVPYGPWIVDVGGNWIRHHFAGRKDIWCTNPYISSEDYVRNAKRRAHPGIPKKEWKFCHHYQTASYPNLVPTCEDCWPVTDLNLDLITWKPTDFTLIPAFEENYLNKCPPPRSVRVIIMVYSIFYFEPSQILSLFSKHPNLVAIVSCHHRFNGPVGTFHRGESSWQRISPHMIRMKVNGNSTPYVHKDCAWLSDGYYSNGVTAMSWSVDSVLHDTEVVTFVRSRPGLQVAMHLNEPTTFQTAIQDWNHDGPIDMRGALEKDKRLNTLFHDVETDRAFLWSFMKHFYYIKEEKVKVVIPKEAVSYCRVLIANKPRTQDLYQRCTEAARHFLTQQCKMTPTDMADVIPYVVSLAFFADIDVESGLLASLLEKNHDKVDLHTQLLKFNKPEHLIPIARYANYFRYGVYTVAGLYGLYRAGRLVVPFVLGGLRSIAPTPPKALPTIAKETALVVTSVVDRSISPPVQSIVEQLVELPSAPSSVETANALTMSSGLFAPILAFFYWLRNLFLPRETPKLPTGYPTFIPTNYARFEGGLLFSTLRSQHSFGVWAMEHQPIHYHDVCNRGRPLKLPMQKDAKVTLPEDTYCRPKFGCVQYGPGVLIRRPMVARSCVHNDHLAVVNRGCLRRPDETPQAREALISAWQSVAMDFCLPQIMWPEHAIGLLSESKKLTPTPFNEWVSRFPPARRAELEFAKSNFRSLHKLRDASDCFIKREFVLKSFPHEDELYDPRLIQGRYPEFNVQTGPFFHGLSKFFQVSWNGNYFITYAPGLNANELGQWLQSVIDKFGLHAIVFIERDYIRWDATQSLAALLFRLWLYGHYRPSRALIARYKQLLVTHGHTSNGVVFRVTGTVTSGASDTTCGNSATNAAVSHHIFSECVRQSLTVDERIAIYLNDALNSETDNDSTEYQHRVHAACAELFEGKMPEVDGVIAKHIVNKVAERFSQIVAGDDNLAATTQSQLPYYYKVADEMTERLGLNYEEHIYTSPFDAQFCSGRFWPSSIGIIFGPKPGRVLAKTFHSKILYHKEKDAVAWVRGVALGMRLDTAHIPILRVVIARVLYLTENVKAGIVIDEKHVAHAVRSGEATDETFEMMNHVYGYAKHEIVECEEWIVKNMNSLTITFSHPVLNRIVEIDAPDSIEELVPRPSAVNPAHYQMMGLFGVQSIDGAYVVTQRFKDACQPSAFGFGINVLNAVLFSFPLNVVIGMPLVEEYIKRKLVWKNIPVATIAIVAFETVRAINFAVTNSTDDMKTVAAVAMFVNRLVPNVLHFVFPRLSYPLAVLSHAAYNLYYAVQMPAEFRAGVVSNIIIFECTAPSSFTAVVSTTALKLLYSVGGWVFKAMTGQDMMDGVQPEVIDLAE